MVMPKHLDIKNRLKTGRFPSVPRFADFRQAQCESFKSGPFCPGSHDRKHGPSTITFVTSAMLKMNTTLRMRHWVAKSAWTAVR
jgi:hypothetical protein